MCTKTYRIIQEERALGMHNLRFVPKFCDFFSCRPAKIIHQATRAIVSCPDHTPEGRGQCKTWTLDSGLDRGLDSGLDFGLDIGKPGLWTLDWTVDWTLDWILDWILDSIIHGPEGIQKTKLVHNKYNTHT